MILATMTVVSSGMPPDHKMSFSLANMAKGESLLLSMLSSLALSTMVFAKAAIASGPRELGCCNSSFEQLENHFFSHTLISSTISSTSRLSKRPSVASRIRSPGHIAMEAASVSREAESE